MYLFEQYITSISLINETIVQLFINPSLKKRFKNIFSSYIVKKKQQKKLKNEFKLIHKSCEQIFSFRNRVVFMFYYLFVFALKQLKEEEIQIVIHHWIQILNIKLGWIKDFDKIVANYVNLFAFFSFSANQNISIFI
ncbi:hypothetical protein RFI_26649 [Reticulomyxa filosa]|uniref:Uncharacterized protein n=1 Tax=Reticulomyxa filosa TaxID=46433 RepID=X6M9P4_RETFI|nr:hypothetical protein RFI_26649 [Reticulomyxa filosa]|eukprot:ETO10728.1 hypothetical protein RFI_26649 [Reticulomyxa filosa]